MQVFAPHCTALHRNFNISFAADRGTPSRIDKYNRRGESHLSLAPFDMRLEEEKSSTYGHTIMRLVGPLDAFEVDLVSAICTRLIAVNSKCADDAFYAGPYSNANYIKDHMPTATIL